MIRTFEAMIDEQGTVRLLENVHLKGVKRVLVTVLDDEPNVHPIETALLSEAALSEDWNRPEEDAAWAHLQQGR
jgi:hypothetical protein